MLCFDFNPLAIEVSMKNISTKLAPILLGISLGLSSAEIPLVYFKTGNATNLETVMKSIKGYTFSIDKSKVIRTDGQFEVTSAVGIKSNDKGESVFVPYEGPDEAKFIEESLDFDPSDIRFGAANLTYWLGKTIEDVRSFGFLKTKKMNMKVYSHCQDMLNAYFNPKENNICVGHLHQSLGRDARNGMASLSWDADVIVHEMGHGIFQHLSTMTENNYVSFGNDMIGAMNEGQADFFSHVVTGTENLAPWMMTLAKDYYKKFAPRVYEMVKDAKALRAIKNDLRLNSNFFGEIHDDGSILAGTLTDLADKIGPKKVFNLWLNTITKINEANNYFDHGMTMLDLDEQLYQGANRSDILQVLTDRGIFGNDPIVEGDIEVKSKIIDDPKIVTEILKSLGLSDESIITSITSKLNGNGKMDPGECTSVELQFHNKSDKLMVGLELFVPAHMVPEGISSQGQNRNFLGLIPPGKSFPTEINVMNSRRPWLFICSDEQFDEAKPLPIIIRNSGEDFLVVNVKMNEQ